MPKWIDDLNAQVIERDAGLCILCGAPAQDVHHIIPRSRGKKHSPKLWRIENMVCICGPHHDDGHTAWMRERLLRKVYARYAYDMMWTREFGIAWEKSFSSSFRAPGGMGRGLITPAPGRASRPASHSGR